MSEDLVQPELSLSSSNAHSFVLDANTVPERRPNYIGQFKPLFLPVPGEPQTKWPVWYRQFQDFLKANCLENIPDDRKSAIIRSSLGSEGYRICIDLCPESDLSFTETVRRLQNRFSPASSQILSRARFNRRSQQSGEKCAEFVTVLQSLAAHCGYPENILSQLIRDRFVASCANEHIRERLLTELDDLTLTNSLRMAETMERAATETRQVQNAAEDMNRVDTCSRSASTFKILVSSNTACDRNPVAVRVTGMTLNLT